MGTKRVDQCIICYPDECVCFAPKAKAKKTSAPKAPPTEKPVAQPAPVAATPSRSGAARAAMKAAVTKNAAKKHEDKFTPPREPKPLPANAEEVLLQSALRALAPIMAYSERERYKMIVDSTPTVADRTTTWRIRHGQD